MGADLPTFAARFGPIIGVRCTFAGPCQPFNNLDGFAAAFYCPKWAKKLKAQRHNVELLPKLGNAQKSHVNWSMTVFP